MLCWKRLVSWSEGIGLRNIYPDSEVKSSQTYLVKDTNKHTIFMSPNSLKAKIQQLVS